MLFILHTGKLANFLIALGSNFNECIFLYLIALLQRLRRITGDRTTNSISDGNYRRENIISQKKKFNHHSDLQHNHDTYFNLTTLGGRQTPATQDSTTDINECGKLIKDNARVSSRNSRHLYASAQHTSNTLYDEFNTHAIHSEQKSQSSTPYLGKSFNAPDTSFDGKHPYRSDSKLRSKDGQIKIVGNEATSSFCKPTYVQFTSPQITVKKHSTSAEIIL